MRKMRDEIPPDAGAIRSPAPVWYISWLGPRSDLDFFYLFSFVCGARNTEFPNSAESPLSDTDDHEP